jgi:hypothetical protein
MDAIYLDFSDSSDLAPHALLIRRLNDSGLSAALRKLGSQSLDQHNVVCPLLCSSCIGLCSAV